MISSPFGRNSQACPRPPGLAGGEKYVLEYVVLNKAFCWMRWAFLSAWDFFYIRKASFLKDSRSSIWSWNFADMNVSFVFTITIHPFSLPKSRVSLLLSWDWGFSHSPLFCRISHARKKAEPEKPTGISRSMSSSVVCSPTIEHLIASTSNGYKVELIIRSPSHRYNSVWSTSQSEDWDHDQPDPLGSQTTTPSNGLSGRELKCTSLFTAPDSAAFEIALISWFQDVSRSPSWQRGPFHRLNPTSCWKSVVGTRRQRRIVTMKRRYH